MADTIEEMGGNAICMCGLSDYFQRYSSSPCLIPVSCPWPDTLDQAWSRPRSSLEVLSTLLTPLNNHHSSNARQITMGCHFAGEAPHPAPAADGSSSGTPRRRPVNAAALYPLNRRLRSRANPVLSGCARRCGPSHSYASAARLGRAHRARRGVIYA